MPPYKHPSESLWYKLMHYGLEFFGRFYSTYRGFVVDNNDPEGLNRVKIVTPSIVKNDQGRWAFPKNQWGANGYGTQVLPRVGDMVFIEFDHGDVDYPIWSFAGYGDKEKPTEFSSVNSYGIKTPNRNIVIINDGENKEDGDILVRFKTDNEYIKISKDTLELESKLIKLGKDGEYSAVKGETDVEKLQAICDKIVDVLTIFVSHTHPSNGAPASNVTDASQAITVVQELKATMDEIKSNRVKLD